MTEDYPEGYPYLVDADTPDNKTDWDALEVIIDPLLGTNLVKANAMYYNLKPEAVEGQYTHRHGFHFMFWFKNRSDALKLVKLQSLFLGVQEKDKVHRFPVELMVKPLVWNRPPHIQITEWLGETQTHTCNYPTYLTFFDEDGKKQQRTISPQLMDDELVAAGFKLVGSTDEGQSWYADHYDGSLHDGS